MFSSVVPISSLEQQTIYITIQSVTKALAERLKDYSYSISGAKKTEYVKLVSNVMKWAIALGEERIDYAVTIIQDISNSIEAFGAIVMDEDGEFDDMIPEYITFANKHSIVFG